MVQVEDLEVYEPAVAEEEALPEPEAPPATKGEHAFPSIPHASFQHSSLLLPHATWSSLSVWWKTLMVNTHFYTMN